MWFLVGLEQNSGLRIWLKPDATLTIGRAVANDVLTLGTGDITVGRRHVAINVSKPTMQSVRVRGEFTRLTIRDLNSKQGVRLNEKRIESGVDVEVDIPAEQTTESLQRRHIAGQGYGGFVQVDIGDKTSFRLERLDWTLCSQGLSMQAKLGVVSTAAEIDCKVEESWIPGVSTHLIVGTPKQSGRVYLALAEGGHMVSTSWLSAVEKSFQESWASMGRQQARTLELEYPATVPHGKETANIQWTPNIERKTLFEHYRFISIAEARYPNLNQFIECAGGEWVKEDAVAIGSQYLRECINATIQPVFLLPHGVQDVSQSYPKLNSLLKKMSYRWVNEDEIGMAIMYASKEKFCNPKYLDSLPSLEAMASLQSSLANTHSFMGSLAAHSSFAGPSTLPTTLSNVGDTIDSPQVIDDSNEAEMASFSLSQLMPLRKQDRASAVTRATIVDAPSSGPATLLDTAKPAKKKAKTNRMDMFFDGLEEEEDTTAQETIEPNTDTSPAHDRVASSMSVPTPFLTRENSSALCEPVPASWADEPEVVLLQEDMESGEDMAGTRDVEENARLKTRSQSKAEDEIYRNTTSQRPRRSDERIQHSLSQSSLSVEQFSQSSQSFRRSTGSKKKPSPYDTVQEDIMALKLDTRLGRQKDKMDEEERLRRLTAQRQAIRAQEDGSKIMQSEYSQDLVAKKKRRKMEGEEGLEAELEVATAEERLSGMSSPPPGARDRSLSVLLSDEQDRKDWPERWKSLPNFKSKAGVDPILQQKWKDVPNFKAFRKLTMAGKHVDIRRATSVALDDGILEKQKNQEQTIEKIGRYVEREAREISGPAPMPRRKLTEKEMARDDLRMLLAND